MPLHTTTRRCRTLMMILALGIANAAPAANILVPNNQPTIQAAINASSAGDVIIVAPGTYQESIDFLGRSITVRSSNPSSPSTVANTIIDGGGSGRVVRHANSQGPGARLQGFTITNGSASQGAGIYLQDCTIEILDCVISGNVAQSEGGGLACISEVVATVERCHFAGNSAGDWGGGAYTGPDAVVTYVGCSFEQNDAPFGGGMHCRYVDDVHIHSCWFTENHAAHQGGGIYNTNILANRMTIGSCSFMANTSGGPGGAMTNVSQSLPVLLGCAFVANTSEQDGGGVANLDQSHATITNCVFLQNAGDIGGALSNQSGSRPVVTSCTFEENSASSGGAIRHHTDCNAEYTACTFRGNAATQSGGAIYNFQARPSLIDCVFAENTAASGGGMANVHAGSTPVLTTCTFIDNVAETGGALGGTQSSLPSVSGSSFFCNIPEAIGTPFSDGGANRMVDCGSGACCLGDACIIANESACADAGGVYLGDATVCDGSCAAPCPGDTNGDGAVDFADLVSLLSAWGVCP